MRGDILFRRRSIWNLLSRRSSPTSTKRPTIAGARGGECHCTSAFCSVSSSALRSVARRAPCLVPPAPQVTWIVNHIAEPVGQLFLRALLMTVVPLVVSSLIVGVAGIGDVRRLGRVGARTVVYCLVISLISVALGLILANTVRPGTRLDPATRDLLLDEYGEDASRQAASVSSAAESPMLSFVRTLVPSNPLESMARSTPDMIGLMFFSIVFGAALTLDRSRDARRRSLRCSTASSRSSPK